MTLRPLNSVPRGMSFLSKLSAGSAHDLVGADTVGAQQHDLSPPHMLLCGVAIPCECRQSTAISGLREWKFQFACDQTCMHAIRRKSLRGSGGIFNHKFRRFRILYQRPPLREPEQMPVALSLERGARAGGNRDAL